MILNRYNDNEISIKLQCPNSLYFLLLLKKPNLYNKRKFREKYLN